MSKKAKDNDLDNDLTPSDIKGEVLPTAVDENLPPAANPDTGAPTTPGAAVGPPPKIDTHVRGSDLVPNIEAHSANTGVLKRYRYWVGVTPSCPVEGIDIAGVNFPKMNEKLIPDPQRSGETKRQGVVGALVWLTEAKIEKLRAHLPLTVIRFLKDPGAREEPGTGQNIGDNAARPRKGHPIRIPTPAEVRDRQKKGKPTRAYSPDMLRDVPAARFMFAQLCPNQEHPERGEYYPPVLEVTGLDWPDRIESLVADLLS